MRAHVPTRVVQSSGDHSLAARSILAGERDDGVGQVTLIGQGPRNRALGGAMLAVNPVVAGTDKLCTGRTWSIRLRRRDEPGVSLRRRDQDALVRRLILDGARSAGSLRKVTQLLELLPADAAVASQPAIEGPLRAADPPDRIAN